MTLLELLILNEHLAKQIVQIGLIIYIKSQKLLMIPFPSYKLNNYPERYNEALLQKSRLTLTENNKVMKKLNLI